MELITTVDYYQLPLPYYSPRDREWVIPGTDFGGSWEAVLDNYVWAAPYYGYESFEPGPDDPEDAEMYANPNPHWQHNHTHSWRGLLHDVIRTPGSFHIHAEDYPEYSKQELRMVRALQKQLRSDGFKDRDLRNALYPRDRDFDIDTDVVAGTPGIGKSITARVIGSKALDLDYKPYKFLNGTEGQLNPDWPRNYGEAIEEAWLRNTYTFVFVSAEPFVLSTLERMEVPYVLVYPDESRGEEFRKRLTDRGDSPELIENLIGHWDAWIDLYEHSFNPSWVHKLPAGLDLIDVLDYPDFDSFASVFYDWQF